MNWVLIATMGLTKGIPAIFKLFKHGKRYGDVVKALRRTADKLAEAHADGIITPVEWGIVVLALLEALVEFAEASEK